MRQNHYICADYKMIQMEKKSIQEIIASAFEIAVDKVKEGSSMTSIPEWDSLGHIHLMVAIEEEYSMTISMEEFSDLKSIREINVFLKKYDKN